jgi:hypothetical protein
MARAGIVISCRRMAKSARVRIAKATHELTHKEPDIYLLTRR